MNYVFISKNDQECFIEFEIDTFRTRIEFNFTPDDNFKGLAISCCYSFKNHPIGFIKDNGLIRTETIGYRQRPLFEINDTMFQAGPTLISESKPFKDFTNEGFDERKILSGFHAHIGRKQSGNIIVGYSANYTLGQMINRYQELFAVEAIKLPGLKEGAFFFRSSRQTIKAGFYPMPCALIFEPRIEKVNNSV